MLRISVVITAFNEEGKIEECLQSVKDWADEIVVVDCNSSDKTAGIAKKYTQNVFFQKNDPQNIDVQKNFGFSKAKGEWILSLDADERVTDELKKEIDGILTITSLRAEAKQSRGSVDILTGLPRHSSVVPRNEVVTAYWIPRKNIIFGKWIEHTAWYPDYQLRLFKNGKGKYNAAHVHEHLSIDGETEYLTKPLLHYNYDTILQFILRTATVYAPNEAENLLKKKYTFHYLDAIRMPMREFINRFFSGEGYKDGLHGLVLSLLMAWYHFMIFLYIWEKKKFIPENDSEFLKKIEQETTKQYKELVYWFYQEKIKQTKNLSEKYLLKLKRKLS